MKEFLLKLIENQNLSKAEAEKAMSVIMSGQATPSQIAGFLVALRKKGETIDEIAGCALAMREAANKIVVKAPLYVDNCGTGGDSQNSLNISTAASFVVAGAGLPVAKHGNKSISSKCGSADVLQAMGVRVDGPTVIAERCINEAGIGFMFAPVFHPAMKHAMPARRELGIRTVFNILGPLTNPARAQVQLIGVFHPDLTQVMAQSMLKMGLKGGLVVHSGGWDEITLSAPTLVSEVFKKKVRRYKLTHKDFGLPRVPNAKLKGGDAAQNAKAILDILNGQKHGARPVVLANAAALIWISERVKGKSNFKLKDAVKVAENSIDSGAAFHTFKTMAEVSHSLD